MANKILGQEPLVPTLADTDTVFVETGGAVKRIAKPNIGLHAQNTDTGTMQTTWQVGQNAAGSARSVEALGTATDISLGLKPKGAGKVKLEGASYVTTGQKVLIVNNLGEVIAQFDTAEEQVAIPASLSTAGTPGTWAREAGFLYFCYGAGWEKIPTISSQLSYVEQWVAIPMTPTSTGSPGQRAYDSTNALIYDCVGSNTWVRHAVTTTW